jgi:hypothetical protein
MLIVADALGLTVLALQVTCAVFWMAPNDGYRVISGTLIYFVLAATALGFWHYEKLVQRFSNPNQWFGLASGSILLGGLSFCADILIGTVFHSGSSSAFDAASKAGGPFGIALTLLICPGLTAVAVAGLARSFLLVQQI